MGNTQKVNYQITGENLLSKVLRQINSDADKTENAINRVSQTGTKGGMLGSIIKGNLISNAISRASGEVTGFIGDIKRSLVNYEYFSTSVKTMLNGNTYAAKALEGQLVTMARTTPFELKDVQDGTKQLMAYGFAGGEVVSTMRMLGDVTAGLGADKLPFIIRAFGQIKSKGHLAGQELNQLTEQGFNPLKIISEKTGKSYGALLKEMEKGQISFKMVEQSFRDVTSAGGQFFNLMEEQSKTVGGRLSAFADIWEQIRVNIGKSQTGIIAGTLDFMTQMSSKANDKLSAGNFMDEAFKAGGAKNYSSTTAFYGNLAGLKNIKGLAGNFPEMKDQAMYMQSLIEQSTTGEKAQKSLQYIGLNRDKLNERYKNGEVDSESFTREMSLYSMAYRQITGSMQLLKTKAKEAAAGSDAIGAKEKADRLGTGVTIESHAPKNQYITINGGLVHQMTIESMDGGVPTGQIKEQVSTVLVELLNDAYRAQR